MNKYVSEVVEHAQKGVWIRFFNCWSAFISQFCSFTLKNLTTFVLAPFYLYFEVFWELRIIFPIERNEMLPPPMVDIFRIQINHLWLKGHCPVKVIVSKNVQVIAQTNQKSCLNLIRRVNWIPARSMDHCFCVFTKLSPKTPKMIIKNKNLELFKARNSRNCSCIWKCG